MPINFQIQFSEMNASHEKILFYIFDLHIEYRFYRIFHISYTEFYRIISCPIVLPSNSNVVNLMTLNYSNFSRFFYYY